MLESTARFTLDWTVEVGPVRKFKQFSMVAV